VDLAERARWLAAAAWRRGADLPYLADHRGQVVLEGPDGPSLYLVGGERGHAGLAEDHGAEAAPGRYLALPYLVRHDFATGAWTRLADLPLPVHHVEHQVVVLGGRLLVVLSGGGDGSLLVDLIQVYDLETDRWEVHDSAMPTPLLGAVAWVEGDRILVNGGQTWFSPADRRPGEVLATTLEVRYTLSAAARPASAAAARG
jgi:hypothetical protein